MSSSSKIGRGLAKAVGIDVDYRQKNEPAELVRTAAGSIHNVDTFEEPEPTLGEVLRDIVPTASGVRHYFRSLFPFLNWILHYNYKWGLGDFIAGVTVGFVVIPQGMAYAVLAGLPVEYGLYTSFVGFILYWAFATSKDITIGTVAVMSTLVGNIIARVTAAHGNEFPPEMIARALSVICGSVLLFLGLFRLGWIVELIPLVGITSFMTGAAINIAAGQVPKMLGISTVNTRQATYLVIIQTLQALPTAKGLDAAMGVSAMVFLYIWKWTTAYLGNKQLHRQKLWFFLGTLRMAVVIILYILISWLANRGVTDKKKAKFDILGVVPSGFQVHNAPTITPSLLSAIGSEIPGALIVLIIEHISISKSFGRVNNYVIDPSQELVAVGFTNVLGPFLGAYPATGSFSRTAIKSKAGVRTPLAGIWTALIVLLALYALTGVFFFIPSASLSGLIIHAVGDLITAPNVVYQFWQVSPLEVLIFFAGVIVMIFADIETGIYVTMGVSAAVLLVRIAKARGAFLGQTRIYRVNGDEPVDRTNSETVSRLAYVPLDHRDGSNPEIDVHTPYPGVIVYRFKEGFNYLNAGRHMDILTAWAKQETRPTIVDKNLALGDRPWNDPGPRRGQHFNVDDNRPTLRAIVLDFSAVNAVDVTSIQALIDTRNQLDRHASPDPVDWHFVSVTNRWTKRALGAAGFGFPSAKVVNRLGNWKPIYSAAATSDQVVRNIYPTKGGELGQDVEVGVQPEAGDKISPIGSSNNSIRKESSTTALPGKVAVVGGMNRPYFHIDLQAAVESAVTHIEGRVPAEE
ncbi:sulfate transporter family-domain-containing protein [Microdochium trichocladiopsis]|uniref:Sulfate transporter family-domain-containing protein n=1 Tax=Microdochium trichocladiopsis TaxID=1682393 RepID=A0A9P8Y1X3_9PEZI|nr:sulfate transporter family-domain-containing protein [Microdochium trichocladiopsis]KAH7028934.1 sulfate transporter family-domain-containing protein [Microdochium trichocladiopsis]